MIGSYCQLIKNILNALVNLGNNYDEVTCKRVDDIIIFTVRVNNVVFNKTHLYLDRVQIEF